MHKTTSVYSRNDRRREERVRAAFPMAYCFSHISENSATKTFRTGVTHNISMHGVFFEAIVVDPTIIPAALQGDIQVYLRVNVPGERELSALCRLAWSEPVKGGRDTYFVGAEYLDIVDGGPEWLFNAAKKVAPPS